MTVHEEHDEELDLIVKFTCSFEYVPFPCFFNGCVRLFVAIFCGEKTRSIRAVVKLKSSLSDQGRSAYNSNIIIIAPIY